MHSYDTATGVTKKRDNWKLLEKVCKVGRHRAQNLFEKEVSFPACSVASGQDGNLSSRPKKKPRTGGSKVVYAAACNQRRCQQTSAARQSVQELGAHSSSAFLVKRVTTCHRRLLSRS